LGHRDPEDAEALGIGKNGFLQANKQEASVTDGANKGTFEEEREPKGSQ